MLVCTKAVGGDSGGLFLSPRRIQNIGAEFLNHWILTLDLDKGRAWLAPYKAEMKAKG